MNIRVLFRQLHKLTAIDHYFAKQLSEIRKLGLQTNILESRAPGISDEKYCEERIVVSLTSYGARIHEVALTIESLMEQTLLPNRLILWLSEDERDIPMSLRLLEKRGLEIRYCEDIKSYKKLIPTLQLCPEATIITFDDDVFYDFDAIEQLVKVHLKDSKSILAHRAHKIILDKNGVPLPYNQWEHCIKEETPSRLHFPVGVGGILYPPECLHQQVLNQDRFMKLCPNADDIWFKCMAILQGTKSRSVFSHNSKGEDYLENYSSQNSGLFLNNVLGESNNDSQLRKVLDYYNLYSHLQ